MAEGGARSRHDPASSQSSTITEQSPTGADQQPPVLRLRLQTSSQRRKVTWDADTVDNETMGKKKSKCCCIYRKPRPFGESSSDEEDDCGSCRGHGKPQDSDSAGVASQSDSKP